MTPGPALSDNYETADLPDSLSEEFSNKQMIKLANTLNSIIETMGK
jgi:hypothetical protein